jgi:ABC-type antimicrobial peptide transport system permease subunit
MGTAVSSIVALVALIISCIGVFALLSHSVERRTREIGIRMAIGATPGAISRLVMSDALLLVVCGLVVGIPGALGATSLVRSLLYGVTSTDAVTLAISVVVLLATALIAALQPTMRAVKVDPATALRAE